MTQTRCRCVTYEVRLLTGETFEGIRDLDPDCPKHGLPPKEWPAGHPLRRYALRVDRHNNEVLTMEEARRRYASSVWDQTRAEYPRETEARLYREALDHVQMGAA